MEKLKKIITNILLVFAFISIGFALGKNSVKTEITETEINSNESYIAVYYLHSSFRCETCNTIEKMTKELLNSSYNQELKEKKILWFEDDFQENEVLAKQFEVLASCVVVAKIEKGKPISYKRLDEVWTKMANKIDFEQYISGAINSYLNGENL